MSVTAIILAAGLGTRMQSSIPKVMHKVAGVPMLGLILQAASHIAESIKIVSSEDLASDPNFTTLAKKHKASVSIQKERLGTAHAAYTSLEEEITSEYTLILCGDCPLIQPTTLSQMLNIMKQDPDLHILTLGFATAHPFGYGRLITNDGNVLLNIIEEKSASTKEKEIKLCNSGTYLIKTKLLTELINKILQINTTHEYYLTDIIHLANLQKYKCKYHLTEESEVMGVNDKEQLSKAENIMQNRIRKELMRKGALMLAPETVFCSLDTEIGQDSVIHPYVVFGPNVKIHANTTILPYSHIEDAEIGSNTSIGPFARIRGGVECSENVRIGNFVEVKKSKLKQGAKVLHLSYIGDSSIGKNVNIGAGTITCNYDGFEKHATCIDDNAFIGSNSTIIAPINIGKDALIAAGSVISKEVEENELAFGRAKQHTIPAKGMHSRRQSTNHTPTLPTRKEKKSS